MDTKSAFERLYTKKNEAAWTFKKPHNELVRLAKSMKPCRTLEIGCGEGWHAIYLASKGFDVTGIDFSRNAIRNAKQNAKEKGVKCKFVVMNWKDLGRLSGNFDFVFDWRFLHEITNENERKIYAKKVSKKLNRNGFYMSSAFSRKSRVFGRGKIIKLPDGIALYFAKLTDIEKLFESHFKPIKKKIIRVPEKGTPDIISYFVLMKKI